MNGVILWDFDGTLGWRDGGWSGTLHEVLLAHDPLSVVTVEDIRPHLQQGFPWMEPEKPHAHLNTADAWWSSLEPVFAQAYERNGIPSSDAQILASRVRSQYLSQEGWHLFDDVVPVLKDLHDDGWRHIILSNHVPELRPMVSSLGLDRWVAGVASSAEVGYEKPHAQAYRHALALAGHPKRVWMVGDNCEADVLGAERNGIKAVLVRRRDPRAARFASGLTEARSIIHRDADDLL